MRSRTTRTGPSATCMRRSRLERLHGRRHVLLARPTLYGTKLHSTSLGELPLLDRHWSASCSMSVPCGFPASCRASCSMRPPPDGTALVYPFLDTLDSPSALMMGCVSSVVRSILVGLILMAVNIWHDHPQRQPGERDPRSGRHRAQCSGHDELGRPSSMIPSPASFGG
jgi:hypothetical protein